MKTVLVTGASGFIGSHIVEVLSERGYKIIAPVRNVNSADGLTENGKFCFLPGEFFSPLLLQEYVKLKPQAVIHLAAIRGEGHGKWEDYFRVNVAGTSKLVDFALQNHIGPFIYVSSTGVYGTIPREIPAATNQPLHPDNYYHRSKAQAEKIVTEKLAGKLPFVIMRPAISYGERDNGFLPRLISMVQQKKFILSRKPLQIHLLNVQLLANAILQILEKETGYDQIFNAADSDPIFLSEIVDLIYEIHSGKSFPRMLTSPHLFFQIGESIIHLAGLRHLETSIKLISNSWTYVVEPFHRTFCPEAPGTLETIRELLMNNNG